MALSAIKPPPILPQVQIVDQKTGSATPFFIDWLEKQSSDLVTAINALNVAVTALQAAQTQTIAQAQANTTVAMQAAQAQATADTATGSGAQSGDATSSASALAGGAWTNGPQVNLAGVSAGNLTVQNSGPSQAAITAMNGFGAWTGNWRIQEIVGAIETTVFTGTFSMERYFEEFGAIIFLFNETDTGTFSSARASTGAVSYRLDINSPDVDVFDVNLYLYVRRA